MPVQAIGYNSLGPGERLDLSTTDSGVIGLGVSVISTNSYGVFGAGTNQSVLIQGYAAGTIGLHWLTGTDSRISVGAAGAVQGYEASGMSLNADRIQVSNLGQITGATNGILLRSADAVVMNAGVIDAFGVTLGEAAIRVEYNSGFANDGPLIQNSGTLRGHSAVFGSGYDERLENSGRILGAVRLNEGSDTLINRGLIEGTVETGTGADLIDNRGGTISGSVDLGAGYDQIDNGGGVINGHVTLTQGFVVNRAGTVHGSISFGDFGDILDMIDGRVYGQVYMGGGDDVLDSRGTGLVSNGASGGDGNDSMTGGSAGDLFWGDADNDDLRGRRGDDTLNGGAGTDLIYGGADDDEVSGDTGNDTLYGGAGQDSLFGGSNEDLIYGGADDDLLDGGGSADRLYGGSGDDTMDGGTNNDMLSGGHGDDELIGNTGNDTLYGGWGADTLTGGTAADVFVFNTLGDGTVDEITDFNVVDDTIRLDDAAFAGLTAGALAAAAFVANTSGLATSAAHRVIYDTDSGALWFDADGSGAGAAVQFATLTPGLAMTAADFFVY